MTEPETINLTGAEGMLRLVNVLKEAFCEAVNGRQILYEDREDSQEIVASAMLGIALAVARSGLGPARLKRWGVRAIGQVAIFANVTVVIMPDGPLTSQVPS